MGICSLSCHPEGGLTTLEEVRIAIKNQKLSSCRTHLKHITAASGIDDNILVEENLELNPLGYALLTGKVRSFTLIKEELGASLEVLEHRLQLQGSSGMSIICTNGFSELFVYTLPFYIQYYSQRTGQVPDPSSITLDFSKSEEISDKTPNNTHTPVHIACIRGHIGILQILLSDDVVYPYELNMHAIDQVSGENSALLATRTGNLTMLKYLHENCKVNFNILNKRSENCINVAAAESKKRKKNGFLEIIKYLVEHVKLDITQNHEETLLSAEIPQIVSYIERKLFERGLKVSKRELEMRYTIKPYPVVKSAEEAKLAEYDGTDFSIKQLLSREVEELSRSVMSEISGDDRRNSDFFSTMSPFQE